MATASRQARQAQLLVHHMRSFGLHPMAHRTLSVCKGGVSVSAIPLVDPSTPAKGAFRRHVGAISLTNDGGAVACLITMDDRTSIGQASFFHVVGDRVMQGPAFDAKAFRPPHPPDPGPLRTAVDPGPLAVYALRVLSTDIEARFAEPEIDSAAFQSEQNLSFVSNVAREMFNQMRGGGINPVAFSTSCSSSCFGCTSCSSSGSGLVVDPDPVLTSILGGYIAVIPVEAQVVAQRLLEDPGALSQ